MNLVQLSSKFKEEVEIYDRQKYLTFKTMHLGNDTLDCYLNEIRSSPKRRVICKDPNVTWSERHVSSEGRIARLFLSTALLDLISALIRRPARQQVEIMLWASSYEEGEFIHRHVDSDGDFQIILCIEATSRRNGGALFLQLKDHAAELQLEQGEAVLFCATAVEHWTSPVIATPDNNFPQRTTIACRYWLT